MWEVGHNTWILIGIVFGAAAGALGAYVGWRRAAGPAGTRLSKWIAALTFVLALGLGAVALSIRIGPLHRALLFLPSAILLFWLAWQVRAIRSARRDESESCGGCGKGCHGK